MHATPVATVPRKLVKFGECLDVHMNAHTVYGKYVVLFGDVDSHSIAIQNVADHSGKRDLICFYEITVATEELPQR